MNEIEWFGPTPVIKIQMDQSSILSGFLIRGKFKSILDRKPEKIVIDFSNSTYIDSNTLGSIINLLKEVKTYGGCIYLCSVSQPIANLLEISNLNSYFIIIDSLKDINA